VQFFVKPQGGSDADGIFGAKRMFFGAQLPAARTPNANPSLANVLLGRDDANGEPAADPTEPIALARCGDAAAAPIAVTAGERITLLPEEPDGVREDYLPEPSAFENRSPRIWNRPSGTLSSPLSCRPMSK
jgi:hypothetical protein